MSASNGHHRTGRAHLPNPTSHGAQSDPASRAAGLGQLVQPTHAPEDLVKGSRGLLKLLRGVVDLEMRRYGGLGGGSLRMAGYASSCGEACSPLSDGRGSSLLVRCSCLMHAVMMRVLADDGGRCERARGLVGLCGGFMLQVRSSAGGSLPPKANNLEGLDTFTLVHLLDSTRLAHAPSLRSVRFGSESHRQQHLIRPSRPRPQPTGPPTRVFAVA